MTRYGALDSPLVTHEWKWRPSADLPGGGNDDGIDDYDRRLADIPRGSIFAASMVFTDDSRCFSSPSGSAGDD
jgi:hypothetical protein